MPFSRQLTKFKNWLRNLFAGNTIDFSDQNCLALVPLLKKTELFNHLDQNRLEKLCRQSQVLKFNPGEVIVREGEVGDSCYIIIAGSVRVFVLDATAKELVLARLDSGQYFGEQALLIEGIGRRNANVRALTTAVLLQISRENFQEILDQNHHLRKTLAEKGKQQLLSRIASGHHLYQVFQKVVMESVDRNLQHFKANTVIFSEGDVADGVYLLLSGLVEISLNNAQADLARKVQVHAGHLFGELGVILKKPRAGTARAVCDVSVLYVNAEKFLQIYNSMPELRELFGALSAIYQLPSYGVVDQYLGKVDNMDAIFTTYKMNDGSVVTATRIIQSNIFSISRENELLQISAERLRTVYYEENHKISRKLVLYNNQCLQCANSGAWEELGKVCSIILERTVISDEQIDQFVRKGTILLTPSQLTPQPTLGEEIICDCMQVTRATLLADIQAGLTNLKALSAKTGAGTICGSCVPKIMALTGHNNWYPVKIIDVNQLTKTVRCYRLLPLEHQLPKFKPGQYIIIQAQINNRWIERPYTISSYAEQPEFLEITVKQEALGLFSNWLFKEAKTNQTIMRISPPQGEFVINTLISRPAICFVAGVGVTPIMAFILALNQKKSKRRLHIDYSIHSKETGIFLADIHNKILDNPKITLKLRDTSREGRIKHKEIISLIADLPNADIFICGPQGFKDFILEVLQGKSVGKVYIEDFIPVGGPVNQMLR